MFRRRIPFNQIAFATLLGVGGGLYIYKPMFEAPRRPPDTADKQDETLGVALTSQNAEGQESTTKHSAGLRETQAAQEAKYEKIHRDLSSGAGGCE